MAGPFRAIIYTPAGDSAMDDTNDAVRVNIVAGSSSGTEYTEDDAAAANPAGGVVILIRDDALSGQTTTDGDNVAARGTDKGELYVKHADVIDVDATGQGDIPITLDGEQPIILGIATLDAAATGFGISAAAQAVDVDDTAPPTRIDTEGDATSLAADFDGAIFVRPHGPQVWSYHADGSSALTDATVHASPGAGLSLYVTDIVVSSGAATAMNIFFEEGSTKVLGPYYLEAIAGRGLSLHFQTPKKITAATALTVTTSAAIAHSVDVTGFVGQG